LVNEKLAEVEEKYDLHSSDTNLSDGFSDEGEEPGDEDSDSEEIPKNSLNLQKANFLNINDADRKNSLSQSVARRLPKDWPRNGTRREVERRLFYLLTAVNA